VRFVSTVDAPREDQASNYTNPDVGAIEIEVDIVVIVGEVDITVRVRMDCAEPAQAAEVRWIHIVRCTCTLCKMDHSAVSKERRKRPRMIVVEGKGEDGFEMLSRSTQVRGHANLLISVTLARSRKTSFAHYYQFAFEAIERDFSSLIMAEDALRAPNSSFLKLPIGEHLSPWEEPVTTDSANVPFRVATCDIFFVVAFHYRSIITSTCKHHLAKGLHFTTPSFAHDLRRMCRHAIWYQYFRD
jgi:hypothetical protein